MNDPGAKPITVHLFGEDLPLKLTRRGLRRAEYESRTPLFGASGCERFWEQIEKEIAPFQVVVLMYAALVHLDRYTFDQVDEEMDSGKSAEYLTALTACLLRDFPAPTAKDEEAEPPAPFVESSTTG